MELKHIDISHLSISPANMRGVTKKPNLNNILPSVRGAWHPSAIDRQTVCDGRRL